LNGPRITYHYTADVISPIHAMANFRELAGQLRCLGRRGCVSLLDVIMESDGPTPICSILLEENHLSFVESMVVASSIIYLRKSRGTGGTEAVRRVSAQTLHRSQMGVTHFHPHRSQDHVWNRLLPAWARRRAHMHFPYGMIPLA